MPPERWRRAQADMRVGIVGAGMSGLACAERLARSGHTVALWDKGRSAGGRMSVRRIATSLGEAAFDHGAQYFTARDPGFRARADDWISKGCLAAWPAAGADAYVGTPGMNAPLRQMAEGLPVQWGARVTGLSRQGPGWRLLLETGAAVEVDAVVLALPAEQAAELTMSVAPAMATRAQVTKTMPCWTVMAAFADRVPTTQDCWRGDEDEPLGWAARNGSKPGRKGPEAWVLQASPGWSSQYLEAPENEVTSTLLAAFSKRLGTDLATPISQATHRWRYARSGAEGSGAIWDAEHRLGMCGDWLIGPRVEAAWVSGTALAEHIRSSL